MTATTPEQLKNLEQMLLEQTPTLSKTAPKQLREIQTLVGELKRAPNKPMTAAQQGVLKNLFVWQLDLKRQVYAQKIADLAESVALGNPVAIKATRAFEDVVKVLDEAKQAMLAGSTSALALRQIDVAAAKAKESLQAVATAPAKPGKPAVAAAPVAAAAARKPAPAAPVSASASALNTPKPPAKLEAFRALPGSSITAPPRPGSKPKK